MKPLDKARLLTVIAERAHRMWLRRERFFAFISKWGEARFLNYYPDEMRPE